MNDFQLDPKAFEQILRTINMKAQFYSTVLAQEQEEPDNYKLGYWLREYIQTHKQEFNVEERQIWD